MALGRFMKTGEMIFTRAEIAALLKGFDMAYEIDYQLDDEYRNFTKRNWNSLIAIRNRCQARANCRGAEKQLDVFE